MRTFMENTRSQPSRVVLKFVIYLLAMWLVIKKKKIKMLIYVNDLIYQTTVKAKGPFGYL